MAHADAKWPERENAGKNCRGKCQVTARKQAAASQIRKIGKIPHTRANAKIPKKNRLEKASDRNGNQPPKIGSGKALKFPHAREKGRLRKEAKLFLPTEPHTYY